MLAARKRRRLEDLLADIERIRAEAEALIDRRTIYLKKCYQNQPVGSLRAEVTQHDTCACRVAERLITSGEADV